MDKTFDELLPKMLEILRGGGTFWGKFTCLHCGARQTFETPNKLFLQGKCEECGGTSNLNKWGLLVLLGG